MLSTYRSFSYRLFRPQLRRIPRLVDRLGPVLLHAGISVRPEVQMATLLMTAVLAGACGLLLTMPYVMTTGLSAGAAAALVAVPLLLAGAAALPYVLGPVARAQERAKSIDAHLPAALHYVATMASAGTSPERVFAGLARQQVYGEVAREAAYIVRDLRLLGRDLRSAFRAATERSPSVRMQGLLQGAVTALDAGDDLAQYFMVKSRQFDQDDRQRETKFLEGLGVLAESYVTLVVAGPVFLLVLLSVLVVLGSGPGSVLTLGYFVVLGFIPLVQVLFFAVLSNMTPEGTL